ncbi:MAG: DUF378 domain-containing protein [Chlamydiia bacterium]|nr:DUF378 domain-containing protein [Chlamydiia bacterium]
MKKLDIASLILIWIGALNWGVIGIFDFDLIHFIFDSRFLDRFFYIVIAAAAIYQITNWRGIKQRINERVSAS